MVSNHLAKINTIRPSRFLTYQNENRETIVLVKVLNMGSYLTARNFPTDRALHESHFGHSYFSHKNLNSQSSAFIFPQHTVCKAQDEAPRAYAIKIHFLEAADRHILKRKKNLYY